MDKKSSRFIPASRALLFWTLFIGVGAVAGAIGMLADTSGKLMGMDAMLPYFKKLPFADILFNDLLFSGIALLVVNGLTNLVAAALILKKQKLGYILGGVFGITLMLWICIQFYMFPLNFMSTAYFIFGFLQAITGLMTCIFKKQEEFAKAQEKRFTDGSYSNIGTNKSELVVYFSRMGYVKKLAYEKANQTGADILQIKSTEKTDKTSGFWWCGRFAMHKWDMPIEHINVDLSSYAHITICTPIWVFNICAPIRTFCKTASGKIKSADYILVHFSNMSFLNAAVEMDKLLGLQDSPTVSVCSRCGRIVRAKSTDKAARL